VSDVRKELVEAKVVVEALQRDVKSYDLLQKSQPSYMYAEMMAQTRLTLQDDNARLSDEVYLLRARLSASPSASNRLIAPGEAPVDAVAPVEASWASPSQPGSQPGSPLSGGRGSPDSARTEPSTHASGTEEECREVIMAASGRLSPASPVQAVY
jgi:hypothetical protein